MSVALDHTCTLQLIIQRVGLVLLLDIGVTCYDDAWAWATGGARGSMYMQKHTHEVFDRETNCSCELVSFSPLT